MSASLVGSEMCIRDRCCSTAAGVAAGASGRTQRPPRGTGLAAGGAGTVSYTHLTLPTICSV
eukprot:15081967-Alexandrium_andersonii.AAC.1